MSLQAAEAQLYDAMVREDFAALDALIDARATYVHSDGVEESKTAYLQAFRDGRYEYDYVGAWDPAVHAGADLAVVTARAMMLVSERGKVKNRVPLLSTLVWIRGDGGWRLLRRHATRLAEGDRPWSDAGGLGKAWAESGSKTNATDPAGLQTAGQTIA